MLLEPLVSTIKTLQERIQTHGVTLRENETRTRMALIDPLLTALGWDTSDPALVTPEYNVSGQWADYALLGPDGKPVATVEAKKLGEPLSGHRMQMLNYSNAAGIQYAGLTDGNLWELYKVFEVGTLDERRILELGIADSNPFQGALELLLLWHPNLGSGQPTAAEEPVLDSDLGTNRTEYSQESQRDPIIDRVFETETTTVEELGWIPLSQITDFDGNRPPSAIRFHRGEVTSVKWWVHVLSEVAEWLCQEGKLTHRECPIEVGSTRNLVSTSPVHRNGGPFRQARRTSTGLLVELNFGPRHCVEHTRLLLSKLGVPVDSVELRFEQ